MKTHASRKSCRRLLAVLLLAPLAMLHADGKQRGAPNVLFIIADDLNRSLPCYGQAIVKTPNVDRLAARAVRFDRAYCQYPVCSPSRVSFLSGRRPEQTRMFGNEGASRTPSLTDAVFLPEYFKQQGYFTA
ncbi:MAG: iduronate-2-sulfatase, partial [Verrucomicrobia bacterium]|nr:iduronate-2-sulfatase [Verrucomicrobiota bacterium]